MLGQQRRREEDGHEGGFDGMLVPAGLDGFVKFEDSLEVQPGQVDERNIPVDFTPAQQGYEDPAERQENIFQKLLCQPATITDNNNIIIDR